MRFHAQVCVSSGRHSAYATISSPRAGELCSSLPVIEPRLAPGSQILDTVIGSLAAFCTTASYLPQVRKCWATGKADDLSLKMFLILALGIGLWVIYGLLRADAVIVVANSVSLCFLGIILYFKLRRRS